MTSIGEHDFYYDFRALTDVVPNSAMLKYMNRTREQYAKLVKEWDAEKNSEWLSRMYFGMKMVFSSSLFLGAADYSEKCNLRPPLSYLNYYAVLSAARAVVMTDPVKVWGGGKLTELEHSKTINAIRDTLALLDKDLSKKCHATMEHFKTARELISYRSPSSGDICGDALEMDAVELCTILVEVAQFNSELLQFSVDKAVPRNANPEGTSIQSMARMTVNKKEFVDREDGYRLEGIERNNPRPCNIQHMMSEGHVEDYFGAWCHDDPQPDMFNPDDYWQIIFDIP